MDVQKTLFKEDPNIKDIVYTTERISKHIIDCLNPSGKCLDPCKGDGSFFKFLPINSDYCELRENKDFFDYDKKVDWII